jgi:hypothetical protein
MPPHADVKTEQPSKNGTTPPAEPSSEPVIGSGGSLTLEIDGLTYSLDRVPKKNSGRRSVITVMPAGSTDPKRSVIDKLDLFSFRSRKVFAGHVADALGKNQGNVIGHLSFILYSVERAATRDAKPATPVLTAARTRAAEKLLGSRNLLDQAAKVMTARGYVGEETNKPLVYLVATSRLLAKPASAILRAESAAGKSELLDRVTELFPEESVEFLSRITPHALYYAGADHLRHKVVVVDEAAGTTEADYAIRTLQTKGLLRLALTVKGKAESFEARGPIALLSGTTSPDLNPENLSRCLALSLDESAEQTKRVQDAQRRAWAGRETKGAADVEVWKDVQRLLEPLEVVIPFAEQLSFPARTTSDRRDNAKLLTLIAAHALLFQRQRERDGRGHVVATVEDYASIFKLVRPVIESSLDGLSSRATVLYRKLVEGKLGETKFTRREAAAAVGWPYMTTTRALGELLAHELIRVEHGTEKPMRFTLIDGTVLGSAASLTPPEALRVDRSR